MGSRSAVAVCETSSAAWVSGDLPETTYPHSGYPSERCPWLVNLRMVTAVDKFWVTDITYIPMRKGFLYLVAVLDLFSRTILS